MTPLGRAALLACVAVAPVLAGPVPAPGTAHFVMSELLPEPRPLPPETAVASWEVVEARAPGRAVVRQRGGRPSGELPGEAILTGLVTDEGLHPVKARLRASPDLLPAVPIAEAQARADGTFRLGALPQGRIRVDVEADGFVPERRWLVLGGGSAHRLDVVLRAGRTVKGTVRDASGRAVAGAGIWVGRGAEPRARSDTGGAFAVHGLPRGEPVLLLVRPPRSWPVAVEVRPGADALAVVLPGGAAAVVRGASTSAARVRITSAGSDPAFVGVALSHEDLAVSGIPGDATVEAVVPGHASWRGTMAPGGALAVVAPGGPRLRGRVVAGDAPVARVEVRLAGREGPPDATSDGDGWFDVPGSERVRVDLDAPGFGRRRDVLLSAGSPVVRLRPRAELTLQVRDAETGRPVSAYDVRVVTARRADSEDVLALPYAAVSVRSDDGQATLRDVPAGSAFVEVRAEGYVPFDAGETELSGEVVVDVALSRGHEVVGRVVERRSGLPIPGARVWARPMAELDPIARAAPDARAAADGRFRLSGLASRPSVLSAHADGLAPASIEIGTGEHVLRLGPGGTVGVTARSRGVPVPGRPVRLARTDLPFQEERVTDATGRATFRGLLPGEWTAVDLTSPARARRVVVAEGRGAEVVFGDPVRVRGIVRRKSTPVPSVSLLFHARDGSTVAASADADGRFEAGLDPGAHRVQVMLPDGAGDVAVSCNVPSVPEHEMDLVLPAPALRGLVRRARSGEPASGASVTAIRSGASLTWADGDRATLAGDDGSFELADLEPGRYRVLARAAGYGHAASPEVDVGVEELPPLELLLPEGGALSGRVTGPGGGPRSEAIVLLAGEDGPLAPGPENVTAIDGTFAIAGLAPGPYVVVADGDGLAPAVKRGVVVSEGAATSASFVLGAGGTVVARGASPFGRVLLEPAEGSPLHGLAWHPAFAAFRAAASGATEVTFAELPAGTYAVVYEGRDGVSRRDVVVFEGTSSEVLP